MSSDTTQGTRSGLIAPSPLTLPRNHLFSLPIPGFLLGSFRLSSTCMRHLRTLRRQNWDTDTTTQRPCKRVACGRPLRSLSFSFFPASFVVFLFSSSSATNRCFSSSSFTSWARVGEGVEEVRPYGPGLPGFVPTLVYVYGVSRIEKCKRAHKYFFQTFNYRKITVMAVWILHVI